MTENKPHKGNLKNWHRHRITPTSYIIVGRFDGHPVFDGEWGYTSAVLKEEGAEIETRNSRYTLVGSEKIDG